MSHNIEFDIEEYIFPGKKVSKVVTIVYLLIAGVLFFAGVVLFYTGYTLWNSDYFVESLNYFLYFNPTVSSVACSLVGIASIVNAGFYFYWAFRERWKPLPISNYPGSFSWIEWVVVYGAVLVFLYIFGGCDFLKYLPVIACVASMAVGPILVRLGRYARNDIYGC